ncbi:MAG: C40 family peptidase [Akkermansiaceae bacterium]|jgi:peptidoglycan DL-endopeptidase CwlO|nr:C40 family peptidase [Akkermansiaceae bacterium]MDP4646858.1 C40 family peptidase [Akkermansiaceae bacterium]MDP4721422.1 C40 family peptidase [Akkermansiaceae bacterium]MDP4778951.1 C40 family peptidase [Akkermansiaceae bacterium]MDP4845782.1 C40 family peptidase [Akkermansiaceae bacterium]
MSLLLQNEIPGLCGGDPVLGSRMWFRMVFAVLVVGFGAVTAEEEVPAAPQLLETSDLKGFSELSEERQKLISMAIETGKEVLGMPYKYGGNGPKDGGFDCSGAMHFILQKVGIDPPRTSSDQYLWVKKHSDFHEVPKTATDTEDECFADLKPGDLVFWSGTYEPNDGRTTNITHVGMYLGLEEKDGRPVMINATNGRSYRGRKGNGFGVYDFRLPRAGSKSKIVGYGTPPGLLKK